MTNVRIGPGSYGDVQVRGAASTAPRTAFTFRPSEDVNQARGRKRVRFSMAAVALLAGLTALHGEAVRASAGSGCSHPWRAERTPHLARSAELTSIAPVSASTAWAVGDEYTGVWLRRHGLTPLIEHSGGRDWTVTASPQFAGSLSDVDTALDGEAWAVGSRAASAVVEHWDGHRWTIVSTPALTAPLSSIAVISPHDIWVVGDEATVAHWDGHRWRVLSHRRGGYLADVVAAGNDVWAVGSLGTHRLAERWDRLRLRGITFLGPAKGVDSYFTAVAAISQHDVWAIGNTDPGTDTPATFDPFVYHWDGVSWRPARPPATTGEELNAMTVRRGGDVLVAAQDRGYYLYQASGTVIWRRHTRTWQLEPGVEKWAVWGLATDPADAVWGVGSRGAGFGVENFPARTSPLIVRYAC